MSREEVGAGRRLRSGVDAGLLGAALGVSREEAALGGSREEAALGGSREEAALGVSREEAAV